MSILIVENLSAMQEEPELPFRVDLKQMLESTEPSEMADIEYWLETDHDVFFEGQTKNGITRRVKIASVETPIRHRVKLVARPGTTPQGRVAIHQALTDETGFEEREFDLTFVNVK